MVLAIDPLESSVVEPCSGNPTVAALDSEECEKSSSDPKELHVEVEAAGMQPVEVAVHSSHLHHPVPCPFLACWPGTTLPSRANAAASPCPSRTC